MSPIHQWIFASLVLSVTAFTEKLTLRKYLDLDDSELFETLQQTPIHISATEFFNHGKPSRTINPTITVILSQYKGHYIEQQLAMIEAQSMYQYITQIYIYQNENYINLTSISESYYHYNTNNKNFPPLKIIHNKNINYHNYGRFSIPLVVDTEYSVIIDDNIILGKTHIEDCIRIITTYNALCGPAGEIILPTTTAVINTAVHDDVEVDNVMWSYMFRTEWIKALWKRKLPTLHYGIDISFSTTLYHYLNITSYIPLTVKQDIHHKNIIYYPDTTISTEVKIEETTQMRWAIRLYWLEQGYTPVVVRHTMDSISCISQDRKFNEMNQKMSTDNKERDTCDSIGGYNCNYRNKDKVHDNNMNNMHEVDYGIRVYGNLAQKQLMNISPNIHTETSTLFTDDSTNLYSHNICSHKSNNISNYTIENTDISNTKFSKIIELIGMLQKANVIPSTDTLSTSLCDVCQGDRVCMNRYHYIIVSPLEVTPEYYLHFEYD